jgi:RNA polymerase sigma-70 factor, ECF subfamily
MKVRGTPDMLFLSNPYAFVINHTSRLFMALHRREPPIENTPLSEGPLPAAFNPQSATFETFFRQFEPRITAYLLRTTGNREIASDLSQETFLRAWQRFAEIQQHPNQQAWLFRVATNLALQHNRHRRHPVGSATPLNLHDDPASSDPGSHWIEHTLIQQVFDELMPKQRALLLLREVYGFTCAETGELLGMTMDATKMALYRARLQFRERYLQKGGILP